jgi:hypothetical protein
MSRSHRRIVLANDPKGTFNEGEVGAALSPGMAIELQADGAYDPLQAAIGEAVKGEVIVAIEDALQGKSVDDAYTVGDPVQYYIPLPGDEMNVLVKDGETIAIGDDLVTEATSGLFVEAAGTEGRYMFKALEAASPSGANALVRCRRV